MAETVSTPPGSAMDYSEHERTYRVFLTLAKIAVVHVAIILLALLMFSFGTNGGFWLGILTIAIGATTAALDLGNRGRVHLSYYALGAAIVFALLSLA